MNNKTIIIIAILALAGSFAAGRFLTPEKVKTVTHTVEVEKIVVKVEHVVTRIIEHKDGTKETIIVADSKTDTETTENSRTDSKEITKGQSGVNISLLAGTAIPLDTVPIWGGSISKPILGPLTLGAWALSNKTVGMSLGLNF